MEVIANYTTSFLFLSQQEYALKLEWMYMSFLHLTVYQVDQSWYNKAQNLPLSQHPLLQITEKKGGLHDTLLLILFLNLVCCYQGQTVLLCCLFFEPLFLLVFWVGWLCGYSLSLCLHVRLRSWQCSDTPVWLQILTRYM